MNIDNFYGKTGNEKKTNLEKSLKKLRKKIEHDIEDPNLFNSKTNVLQGISTNQSHLTNVNENIDEMVTLDLANKALSENHLPTVPKENQIPIDNIDLLNEILLKHTTNEENKKGNKNSKSKKISEILSERGLNTESKEKEESKDEPRISKIRFRTNTTIDQNQLQFEVNEETRKSTRLRTRSSIQRPNDILTSPESKLIEENATAIVRQLTKGNSIDSKSTKPVKRIYRKKPIETKLSETNTNKRKSLPAHPGSKSSISITSLLQSQENMETETTTPTSNTTKNTEPNGILKKKISPTLNLVSPHLPNKRTQKKDTQSESSIKQVIKEEKTEPTNLNSEVLKNYVPEFNPDVTILKLVYFNSIGEVGDMALSSLLKTYTKEKAYDLFSLKAFINKKLVDQIDSEISKKIAKSPLYSLIVDLDQSYSCMFVYIKFLNDSEDKIILAKLFDIKPVQEKFREKWTTKQSGLNEFKLSKYLFDQIKLNIIQYFKLNSRNFISISVDVNILNRLCLTSFQTYARDLFNKDILILPRYCVYNATNSMLNQLKLSENCNKKIFLLSDYFDTYKQIVNLIDTGSIDCMTNFDIVLLDDEFKFDLNRLDDYVKVIDSIYINYAIIKNCLNEKKNEPVNLTQIKSELREKVDNVDFFYMTCLFGDLFKFLLSYKSNSKRFSSLENFILPWNFDGSLLKNLYDQQLTHEVSQKKAALSVNETIELVDDYLDDLDNFKRSVESSIRDLFDLCSSQSKLKKEFLSLTNESNEVFNNQTSHDSSIKMYSYLNEMFDVTLRHIDLKDSIFKIELSLNEKKLQQIIDYYFYELRDTISTVVFKNQYELFFKNFFESLESEDLEELRNELMEENKSESRNHLNHYTRSLLESDTLIKEKFTLYSYQMKKDSNYSIISSLALIYLSIPSIVDMEENPRILETKWQHELAHLEQKLKLKHLNYFIDIDNLKI